MGRVTLQNPAVFWWLVPLVSGLVVLYLLKIRRQDMIVPAAFLWPTLREDIRANSLFQRPRLSLLFWLQLAALAALVLGLARPQNQDKGLLGSATVFVVDASQSMGAIEAGGTRVAAAAAVVRQAVQKMQPTDQVAVIEAGGTPRVLSPLSSDPTAPLKGLGALRVADTEGRIGEALRLASALVSSDEGAKIVVVSDGCFEPVTDFSPGKAQVVFQQVGSPSENLAIEAVSAADTPDGRLLYCGVRNHGKTALSGILETYADVGLIGKTLVTVEPGRSSGTMVAVPRDVKVYQAKLVVVDALTSDNYAACAAPGSGQVKALLVGPGDLFLERALALDPRVTLDKASKFPASGTDGYDLVVFDGVAPVSTRAPWVLSFGAPAGPLTGGPPGPAVFVSQATHPLVESVAFDEFSLGELPQSRLVSGKALVETNQGPAVAVRTLEGQTWIHCTVLPLKSEFPLSVAFPVFIGNVLDAVAGGPARGSVVVETGQTFSFPARDGLTLLSPEGKPTTLRAEGVQAMVREVDRTGVWTITAGKAETPVYASSLTANDSDLTPRATVKLGQKSDTKSATGSRSVDQWKPVLLAALAVLCVEWWVFVRKS